MPKITCSCDAVFEADLPEAIDFDHDPVPREAVLNGTFMQVTCASCGRVLKPEIPLTVEWKSRGLRFFVVPESDRSEYLKVAEKEKEAQILIGYPELADRIAIVEAGLEPLTIEALKYYLLVKASEADPDAELSVWFYSADETMIEFHVFGLKKDEAAVSRVPRSLYERTLEKSRAYPKTEPFVSLKKGNYISVQNLFRLEA